MTIEYMQLVKCIYSVQAQVAKIEVLELLFLIGKSNQPSLEAEMAYNMVSTLRQNLFAASEDCLGEDKDNAISYLPKLSETLLSATNFLKQSYNSLNHQDPQVLFLARLLTDIATELTNINTEIIQFILVSFQSHATSASQVPQPLELGAQNNSEKECINKNIKVLVGMCSGDLEKAERLIQYEFRRSPEQHRGEAVLSAIQRWNEDNR